jgi:(E)-4-hydroxy-3-methylbut-2-enyl-diphosphate synthase
MDRRKTRLVMAGDVGIGGESPVSVQSMWKEPLEGDPRLVAERLARLKARGCALMRFAVPDMAAAEALGELSKVSPLPLVADIHFDHRLALRCLDYPVAKLRINPGNIGSKAKVRELAAKARDRGVPIRVGVNSGSLPADLRAKDDLAAAMVEAALREIAVLEDAGFRDIVVSLKASSVGASVAACEAFAARSDAPLHLGVTEAGPLVPGLVKSAVALSRLLERGIGDTVRVSLSAAVEEEVDAGREIVRASGRGGRGVEIISCPRCGRNGFDVHSFVARWQDELYALRRPLVVAVMGCVVNGPEEARHADIGITGAGDAVLIFRKGEIARRIAAEDADTAFREELAKLCGES